MDNKKVYAKIKRLYKSLERRFKITYKRLPFRPGHNFVFGVLIFGLLFIFWVSTADLPYWWDSVYVTHSAYQFLETNFTPLIPEGGDFAHPPFFIATLALFWKVFGESLFISHFLMLIFAFLALFYTYLLGQELVEDQALGRWIGFFSSFLLLVSPVFLAQLGIVYFEIPVTALAVMAVYYFLKSNTLGYVASASLMLLTKEVSAVVVGVILGVVVAQKTWRYLNQGGVDVKESAQEVAVILAPFLPLFLWFFYHKVQTGWWFVKPTRSFGGAQGLSLSEVPRVLDFLFFKQARLILTLVMAVIGVGALYRKDYRDYFRKETVVIVLLIPAVVSLFFGITEFLYRYIVFGLPFFFLSGLYFSLKLFERVPGLGKQESVFRTTMLGFLVLLVFYLSYGSWDKHRKITNWNFSPLEDNLEYQDIIRAGQDMVKYIENNHADKVIWTSFPANYMLSEPDQHFTDKNIQVRNCNTYQRGDRVEIVVFHVYSPVSSDCLALIRGLNMSLLTPFSRNGKWMQVFQNPNPEVEPQAL